MAVRCWQDSITLRTYPQGPPSPYPRFDHSVYPYTMQDDLLDEAEDRDYVALHLENEFLHVIVLPQLGGKVYSVRDKLAGREVFYRGSVVKPLLLALRGAWVCGGGPPGRPGVRRPRSALGPAPPTHPGQPRSVFPSPLWQR